MSELLSLDGRQWNRDDMLAIPLYNIAKGIFELQMKEINLDDFVLVVSKDPNEAKYFILHKDEVQRAR